MELRRQGCTQVQIGDEVGVNPNSVAIWLAAVGVAQPLAESCVARGAQTSSTTKWAVRGTLPAVVRSVARPLPILLKGPTTPGLVDQALAVAKNGSQSNNAILWPEANPAVGRGREAAATTEHR